MMNRGKAVAVSGAAAGLYALSVGLFVASALAERTRAWEGLPSWLWEAGALALMGAGLLGTAGVWRLLRAHGARGALAAVAVGVLALAALASFIAWFVFGWLTLLAAGATLVAVSLARARLERRGLLLALAGGPLVAAAAVWIPAVLHGPNLESLGGQTFGGILAVVAAGTAVFYGSLIAASRQASSPVAG